MSRKRWTTEKALAAYLALAQRLGHTPTFGETPGDILGALRARGYNLSAAAEHWGMKPNRGRGVREPLPDHLRLDPEPQPEPEPVPGLTPEQVGQLEAERARWHAKRKAKIREGLEQIRAEKRRRREVRRMRARSDFGSRDTLREDDDYVAPTDLTPAAWRRAS